MFFSNTDDFLWIAQLQQEKGSRRELFTSTPKVKSFFSQISVNKHVNL